MLSVILFKVFSTPRGIKARYAGVVPVSVVLPSAVARITSRSVVYASTWRSIKARAQPAVAADALRATRSRLFQKLISYSIFFRSQQRAAKRQTRWATKQLCQIFDRRGIWFYNLYTERKRVCPFVTTIAMLHQERLHAKRTNSFPASIHIELCISREMINGLCSIKPLKDYKSS